MENFSLPLPHGFSLRDTLLCGQCFRWEEQPDGSFTGWAGIHHATLRQQDNTLTVTGSDPDFWTEYLDLLEDYDRWKTAFVCRPNAVCGGRKMRRHSHSPPAAVGNGYLLYHQRQQQYPPHPRNY